MAVVSASIPTRNSGRLAVRALMHGTEVEAVEVDGGTTYVDITGTQERALRTLLGVGATVLDVTSFTQDPGGPAGQAGQGIPNDLQSNRYGKIEGLMGRPK